ncbi:MULTISPECIES: RNA-binding cell elongation regulator Jag/EloR [unclassified Bacillus (in: firmicutes)]|uniref:RNA-binding cell elongation regulator Jag/EloR n=1 Tax=unclassified Bacillus (in: firmicutes) TaxID=185979 RepID=UPI0004169076|nr:MULTISPECIES: RNA-binding cell elongation regulator Jag/EloR [unclassified Bacillus (in: firmicutes)]QHZ44895.1 protein jag [Bacillus sp. NSP9.1]WFA05323.1 RNA-binding cell elongation regulator Jag/EloR [Bacillus sp. HSf4]
MKELTATGRTVDEAVQSGLKQLELQADDAEIAIIDEGKKGLFGIFGHQPAVVKIREKIDPVKEAKQYLENVVKNMGIEAQVTATVEPKKVTFLLKGDKTALLIGKRGQTLNALETLTQLVINRHSDRYIHVVVDAEGYRAKRKETLAQLAMKLADQARRQKKDIHLEPMPSSERKVIHDTLSGYSSEIETYSTGEDHNRHLVISYKK